MKKRLKPNDLGKKYLVENCQKIAISTYLKKIKPKFKKMLLKSIISNNGVSIDIITSKTTFNGLRLWFKCPLCGRKMGIAYKHPISHILGCRDCLNLEYRCRKYKGMVESSYKKNN